MGTKGRSRSFGTKGFTLIELLVVIAIIGLLASIILSSLSTAQRKGRDAKRLSDLRDIGTALQLYSAKHGSYPNTLAGLVTDADMPSLPTDPGSGNNYLYTAYGSGAVCNNFHLGAVLEAQGAFVGSGAFQGNAFCTGGAYVGGLGNGKDFVNAATGDFHTGALFSDGGYVYDVVP